MKESLSPVPAPTIPGFELFECLGEGGMGVVYRARQVTLDRKVAVKILRDELAQEPEYIRRFLREARLAGRLRHANIVSALDCGESGGHYYMVMEFVEGRSLDYVLRREGLRPESEALEIARCVAEALQHAWFHKIIHRDLKPQNVLLTLDGIPKVCDFGLCRDVRDLPHLTSLGLIHCTPEYSSPEQSRGDPDIDIRADLYSLGVTLYEMLTGVLPFEAADPASLIVRHAMDRPVPPIQRNRMISPGANQLVLDLLEKAKEERPASPAVAVERLSWLLSQRKGGRGATTSRAKITRSWRGTARRPNPPRLKSPAYLGAAILAGVLVLLGILLLTASQPPPEVRRTDPGRGRASVQSDPQPAAELTPDDLRRLDLSRFLHAYEPGPDGSVDHWLVLGPLPVAEDRGFDSPVVHEAEGDNPIPGLEFARSDGTMVRWTRHEVPEGRVNFKDLEGWRDEGPSSLALAACWLECRDESSVEIQFATSGGYELQLDRRVLAAAPGRPKNPGEVIRQRIVLGKGWHSILVKARRFGDQLTLNLKVLTPEGRRQKGITIWQ